MSNTTKNLTPYPYGKEGRHVLLPVETATHIYGGSLVSQASVGANLVPGSTASSGPAVGMATHEVNNTGAAGAARAKVETDRIFELANATAGDACSEATPLFSVVYMLDDHTIADNSAGATRQAAGRFCGMSDDGKVRVFVGMANLSDALAAAVDVSITDAGGFTATTDVENALAEIYQHLKSAQAAVLFSVYDFREVTSGGDVGNIAANGGILASDTTPILRGDAAEVAEISWAAANVDPISLQTALPADFDGTANAILEMWVYTDNAGGGGIDAATFTVETSWDGGALVSDTATDSVPAITSHKITATIAAADIPDAASFLTVALTPAAHGNDPIQLQAARLLYKRKLLTS